MKSFLQILALLCALFLGPGIPLASGADAESQPAAEVPLVVFNRTVFVFRGSFLGMSPEKRADRASSVLRELLRQDVSHNVSIKSNPAGQLIMVGETLAFFVTKADVDPLREETLEGTAKKAAEDLQKVIDETLESRTFDSLLKTAITSGIATAVFAALLWILSVVRKWISVKLVAVAARKADALKVGDMNLLDRHHVVRALLKTLSVLRWLIVAILSYEWLSYLLSTVPYTRPWGMRLNAYLYDVIQGIGSSILGALPGLGVALVIFVIARFTIAFLSGVLERMSKSDVTLSWLGPDTMPTTRRLFSFAIWVFAIAMAYPYLPGAQTEAFKGMSVLLGLMVSLGASSIVGQGAAGLILTYTRTMRAGEFVRVGDHEGTVTRMGMFTTTIRTGLGEELTLPNSMITGTVTKNYSRAVQGSGFIVDTVVTIGYDTPWRQVEAMLIEAARRTNGILHAPAPRVFQTALSDYYPEYRLVAQAVPSEPRPRAEIMSMLHANIQDVFNEYGVQIMSPHYMMDPTSDKVVKAGDWYKAPAKEKPTGAN
jgi:small-conductance mechanosensitive channel